MLSVLEFPAIYQCKLYHHHSMAFKKCLITLNYEQLYHKMFWREIAKIQVSGNKLICVQWTLNKTMIQVYKELESTQVYILL